MITRARDLGITIGDPAGIGPEITMRGLADAADALRRRVVLFGDAGVVEDGCARAGVDMPADVTLIDRGRLAAGDITAGVPCPAGAAAQVEYLEAAVQYARDGRIAGLVTAPINKRQARAAGFDAPGHTEFLAQRLGVDDVAMMFAGPTLRVVLATIHIALAEVPAALTPELIHRRLLLLADALTDDFGITGARIGVVGLNPHAGEGGLFGDDEARAIEPGIELARASRPGVVFAGPLVPDAAFRQAVSGSYAGLLAMYHDQALIPVKLVDFEATVNVTLGLPIVRTSPDHGTAYDIAGTGVARADSFTAALELAARLVDTRRATGAS